MTSYSTRIHRALAVMFGVLLILSFIALVIIWRMIPAYWLPLSTGVWIYLGPPLSTLLAHGIYNALKRKGLLDQACHSRWSYIAPTFFALLLASIWWLVIRYLLLQEVLSMEPIPAALKLGYISYVLLTSLAPLAGLFAWHLSCSRYGHIENV